MDFDIATALSVVDPPTVVTAIFVGAVCGGLFLDDHPGQIVVWVFVGASFVVAMMAVRYFGGSLVWEGWVGVLTLWFVFTVSAWVSARVMTARREHR